MLPADLDLERTELLRVLTDGSIGAHFQPIVDLVSDQVAGWEALARYTPQPSLINPMDLVESARRLGLLDELTWTIVRCAHATVTSAAALSQAALILTVNVELEQLDPGNELFAKIASLTWPATVRLVLEITERGEGHWEEKYGETARLLASHDIELAIDDYGAGSARLTFLRHPGWALVKFDRQLIAQDGPTDRIVMAHTSRMFTELGVPTLAEGIETAEQLEQVKALGIGFGQGYHLGRPVSAETILNQLAGTV